MIKDERIDTSFKKFYSRTLPRRNVYWLGISIVVKIPFVFATK